MKAICINSRHGNCFRVGGVYSFYATDKFPNSLQIVADNGTKMNVSFWTDEFTVAGNNTFKIINFDDYLKQAELCIESDKK